MTSMASSTSHTLDQHAKTELIGLINELSDISSKFNLEVKVPELIIIGAQSKGKSSIVEAISKQMFNFTRPDIASRFPIHFRMIYSPHHIHPTWRILKDQILIEEGRTTQQVAMYVERANEALQAQRCVDSNPLTLELRWNKCPNLTFVDLPGLRSLATDENEAILQQQIEAMARLIVSTKHSSSHATFLVVEEAKDDIANFHGLSKVFEMLSHARHTAAAASTSSSTTTTTTGGWVGDDDEDRCKFVLVLNKLDQFLYNSDGTDEDKRAKIQTIIRKFEPKGIPVFFTSLPTSQEKQVFKAEPTEVRASEAFEERINQNSIRDQTEMKRLVPDVLHNRVGFDELRKFSEQTMMEQYRKTLPSIRASLSQQRTNLISRDALQSTEARAFSKLGLSSLCSAVSKTIEQMFAGIPEGLDSRKFTKTVPQEYETLSEDTRFSYSNSVLWKNKKYNKDLQTLLNYELPLFGGSQLRRILWEFQLCVMMIRFPILSSMELKQELASERYAFQNQGSQCVPWGAVLNKFISKYCKSLLAQDTKVFVTRLRSLLLSWFPVALEHTCNQEKYNPPPPPAIVDKLREHYIAIVSSLSERMEEQLGHYVSTTVCDYDESTSYRAQLNYPFTSPTPAASEIHENILRTMRPHLARAKGLAVTDEEELALKLTDDDSPESEETLDKIRTICAIQLGIGCRKISETFGVIFDTLFKRPICTKLSTKMVDWASRFPIQVEEELRANNELLQTLDTQIEKVDQLVDKLDHAY